jgi:hypothetical protein
MKTKAKKWKIIVYDMYVFNITLLHRNIPSNEDKNNGKNGPVYDIHVWWKIELPSILSLFL